MTTDRDGRGEETSSDASSSRAPRRASPQSFPVTEAFRGVRLDRFIQAMLPRMSRSAVQEAVGRRVELASGLPPKASRRLVPGEVVTIHPREPAADAAPLPRLAILAEGDGWLVVDKPAGLSSMPHARHPGRDAASLAGAAPAHRLDRFTSGCLLLTTNAAAARHFEGVFRERRASKVYAAVVEGLPAWDERACNEPLGPDASSRVPGRMRVAKDGEGSEARTQLVVVARAEGAARSLVRCVPHSGRRHQVRVHLAAAGHPVVGDLLYGGDERRFVRFQLGQTVEAVDGVATGRHLLHARGIAFPAPDRTLVSTVAPWPEDFPAELVAAWDDEAVRSSA